MTRAGDGAATVAIVGGGITGLSAAHRLYEIARERGKPIRVCLLEAGDRLGGNIRTERADGYLLEAGPDQFVRHKPAGLELCRRLGLEDELLPVDARSGVAQVVHRGRPVRLPAGCSMIGPSRLWPMWSSSVLSWWGKARISCEPWIAPRAGAPEDESLRSFVTRRFGREPFERIFEPMIAGIFTADADELSLEMTLPQLLQLERQHGSIVKALRSRSAAGRPGPGGRSGGCVTLKSGLTRMVSRLASRLPAECIRMESRVDRVIHDSRNGRWTLVIAGKDRLEADALILACPSYVSSNLLAWDEELARDLARLEYASCATVNLAYPARAVGRALDGFGFFVGRTERLPILACSHVSVKYPQRVPPDRVLLRAFLGGARDPEVLERDDDDLAALAHRTLSRLLRIDGEPLFCRTHRFPESMPQYPVGYRAVMRNIEQRAQRYPGLSLGGGVLGAVGLPDCIASGETAASRAMEQVQDSSRRSARAAS